MTKESNKTRLESINKFYTVNGLVKSIEKDISKMNKESLLKVTNIKELINRTLLKK